MPDWFRDHVFVAQWLAPGMSLGIVLAALFGRSSGPGGIGPSSLWLIKAWNPSCA